MESRDAILSMDMTDTSIPILMVLLDIRGL